MTEFTFNYTVIRSKRRTAAIQVSQWGEVTVRVPLKLPQKEIERILISKREWIEAHIAAKPPIKVFSSEEIEEMRKKAARLIPPKVEYYGNLMGLQPAGIKITSAKTRFGSCSSKKRVCFSLYLMDKPEKAIDYVVVHELAHLKELNHSIRFYAIIEKYMPDYQERIKLLKSN